MQRARVARIDHLIASHYHVDHYGGVPDLAGVVDARRCSPDAAHAIVVTVSIAAGTFTVTKERTGASRTYPIH